MLLCTESDATFFERALQMVSSSGAGGLEVAHLARREPQPAAKQPISATAQGSATARDM